MVEAFDTKNHAEIDQITNKVLTSEKKMKDLQTQALGLVKKANPEAETEDRDYIFLSFVMDNLPKGIIGLLLAVIFSAAMSSTSSELNALASTTTVDFYKRNIVKNGSDKKYLIASKLFTLMWGLIAISFATFASMLENLIQAVNLLGSLFYGTILGIFLVAFYVKYVRGTAVFIAAIFAEIFVLFCYYFTNIAYLHFNIIGCLLVVIVGIIVEADLRDKESVLQK
jgi:Na+/proline symporter